MFFGFMLFSGYCWKTQLNISLPGKDNLIIYTLNHIKAFEKKLLLFEPQLKNTTFNTLHYWKDLKIQKVFIYCNVIFMAGFQLSLPGFSGFGISINSLNCTLTSFI